MKTRLHISNAKEAGNLKLFNKKTMLAGCLLLILIAAVCIFVIQKEFGFNEIREAVYHSKWWWLIPGALCMPVFFLSEGINTGRGLSMAGYDVPFMSKIKYALAGFFFSSITPSASGGQPAQLYFMHKEKISVAHGTFALLLGLMSFQTAGIIIAGAGVVISLCMGDQLLPNKGLTWVLISGFIVNFLVVAFLLTTMFSKKAIRPITNLIIKTVTFFLRSEDKKRKVRFKILRMVSEYRDAAKIAKKNPAVLMKMLLTSLVQLGLYHSITYFVYRALGLSALGLFEIMTLQGMLFISVAALPLPGGSGAAEGGFALLFSTIFPSSLLGTGIILSRLISFAAPLVFTGICLLIYQICEKLGLRRTHT